MVSPDLSLYINVSNLSGFHGDPDAVLVNGGDLWDDVRVAYQHDQQTAYPGRIRGWLPRDAGLIMTGVERTQHGLIRMRCVFDLATKTFMSFNGWMAPSGKIAIVSDQEDDIYDVLPFQNGKRDPAKSELRFYVSALPARLQDYHFVKNSARPLMLSGKPFDLNPAESVVTFSVDSNWAIIDSKFLVRLSTGQVRQLPGTSARFLDH